MVDEHLIFSDDSWEHQANGKFLNYVGPHLVDDLDRDALKRFLRQKRALGALWSYDWDCGLDGPWSAFVCDTPNYDLQAIKKKVRYYVRKSLEHCEVRKVDPDWLIEHGYEIYVNAAVRYRSFDAVSKDAWVSTIRQRVSRPGWECYGVLANGELAAYGLVRVCGQTVQVRVAKFDPAYSSANPMYALYYTIAHDYLKEDNCRDIDNGTRPLHHDTRIEVFLRRMGWRNVHCRLGLYLAWPVRLMLFVLRILRRPCKKFVPEQYFDPIEALLTAQDLAQLSKTR